MPNVEHYREVVTKHKAADLNGLIRELYELGVLWVAVGRVRMRLGGLPFGYGVCSNRAHNVAAGHV